jgi:SMI1/KNR4 family protein SUKH-1
MQEVWRKIETELANLAPDLLTRLHPGVAEEAFTRVESRLGFTLPEEIKAFFRLQNGSMGPFFGSWELLSLDEMCNDWIMMRARPPDPPAVPWEASWLALLRAGSHMRVYINIDAEAEVAQDSRNTFPEVADDLNQFLEKMVRSLNIMVPIKWTG